MNFIEKKGFNRLDSDGQRKPFTVDVGSYARERRESAEVKEELTQDTLNTSISESPVSDLSNSKIVGIRSDKI